MIRRAHSHPTVVVFVTALLMLASRRAHAGGVVTQCGDDTDFSSKLATGGTVTFDCGTATIVVSSTKTISNFVTVDGGGTITLSGDNARRLFIVNDRARLELQNITIENGFSESGHGGAIYNLDTVSIYNSTFRNNATTTEWSGGAIYSSSHLSAAFSTFTDNEAGSGGAIYTQSGINQTNVYASTFDHNLATEPFTTGFGGAVLVSDGATLTVNLSTFINNEARTGGAIAVRASSRLNIDGSTINDNTTTRDGGGIDIDVSMVSLTNMSMSGNFGQQGGALNTFAGEVTMSGVTLSRNSAYYGAGFNIFLGTHTLTNVTFSENDASSSAGAIYNGRSKLTLVNVTLVGNTGGNGLTGGITNVAGGPSPDLRMKNVLIAKGMTGDNCGFGYPATSLEYNLSNDASCGFGVDRDNAPLALGELSDNSGPTLTHLLLPGSAGIDGGTNSGCPSTDQRGLARPFGAVCDVGSVEVGPPTPTPTRTNTRTATATPSATATTTHTTTPTGTHSPTRTATTTPTPTTSRTPTRTTTIFPTPTVSRTPTMVPTTAGSQTPSRTPSATTTQATTATPSSTSGSATPSPSVTATAPRSSCIGDCDDSKVVSVNELVLMVNIALDRQPLSACPAADGDASGTATVQEIVAGVNNALRGCADSVATMDFVDALYAPGRPPSRHRLREWRDRRVAIRLLHSRPGVHHHWVGMDHPLRRVGEEAMNVHRPRSGGDGFVRYFGRTSIPSFPRRREPSRCLRDL